MTDFPNAAAMTVPTRHVGTQKLTKGSSEMTTRLKPSIESAIDKVVDTLTKSAPMPTTDKLALKQAFRDLVSATLANR